MTLNLTKREEEYIEAMYILYRNRGVIRIKDISRMLKVKPPSVVDALRRLSERGLVDYEKYDRILLTEEGKRVGSEIYSKHLLLTSFFADILGVPRETAEKDACQFEHYVSRITVERIRDFARFIGEECPDALEKFVDNRKQGEIQRR